MASRSRSPTPTPTPTARFVTALGQPSTNDTHETTMTTQQNPNEGIYTALDISPYDFVVLKKYLLGEIRYTEAFKCWILNSTSEKAIDDAVYHFRKSFKPHGDDRFGNHPRLETLSKAWTDVEAEEYAQTCIDCATTNEWAESFEMITLKRETTKYNAVRALFVKLAATREYESEQVEGSDSGN